MAGERKSHGETLSLRNQKPVRWWYAKKDHIVKGCNLSVEIEAPAQSMLKSLDSLETTPLNMHRIFMELSDTDTWYAVMSEARKMFGKNWRGQPHVKRKLNRHAVKMPVCIWFDVPDEKFGTWVAVKLAVRIVKDPNK